MNRKEFLLTCASTLASLGFVKSVDARVQPQLTDVKAKFIKPATVAQFEHDWDPIDYTCRKCGMTESEYYSKQKAVKTYNRRGDVIGIAWYGGPICKY